MGDYTHTLQSAWMVYDRWMSDPRVHFHPEPRTLESAFRRTTAPFSSQRASKCIGDGYLLAFAYEAGATLVTFDKAFLGVARKQHHRAILPS